MIPLHRTVQKWLFKQELAVIAFILVLSKLLYPERKENYEPIEYNTLVGVGWFKDKDLE